MMYQRTYPSKESLPPNYKGNAFDMPPDITQRQSSRRDECRECDNADCDKHDGGEKHTCKPKQDREEKDIKNCSSTDNSLLSSLFTRRDGSSFALDDIILGGLIVLLLNNHADDELLLVLVLLFISGI